MPKTQSQSVTSRDQEGDRPALLIIDMINRFDFEGAEELKRKAFDVARVVNELRRDFERRDWPIIYVNDNFGDWRSERSALIEHASDDDNPIPSLIRPRTDDFFIIKPQFSGFYATNLPVLLPKLGVRRLVLTGVATDICVLFTAADAHMRDYVLWVPEDAVAAKSDDRGKWALEIIGNSMRAETAPTTETSLDAWLAGLDP